MLSRNVGAIAARGLAYKNGMKVIAVGDISGAYRNENGIDIRAAEKYAAEHGSLRGYPEAESFSPDELLTIPCDVLVPALASRTDGSCGLAARTAATTR